MRPMLAVVLALLSSPVHGRERDNAISKGDHEIVTVLDGILEASGGASAGATAVTSTDTVITAWPTTVGAAGAMRCVNAAGNAFEACGGASSGGVTTVSVNIDSTTITNPTWVRNAGSTSAVTGLSGAALATETTLGGVKTGTDRIPAQGQALAAASLPVVLTAAQVATLTPPAAITNYANETGGNLAALVAKDFATQTTLSALNGKVTAVNTGAVVLAAGTANIGDVDVLTLPALVAGTANIGDVDVLTLPALAAGTAQIGTVHGSSVTVTPIQVAAAINDGACVSVTATATVLAANTSRRSFSVCAEQTNTQKVYIKLGATATSADFPLSAGQCYNSDSTIYTGVIDAIAASGTQSVCVVSL